MERINGQDLVMQRVKYLLIFTAAFMAIGTLLELFLLAHYEDEWQLLPILLIIASLVLFGVYLFLEKLWVLRSLQTLLIAVGLSGGLGVFFHMKANLEFEAELHPTLSFTQHLLDSFSGALPALAPGSMFVFALIGYIYIYIQRKPLSNETLN